MRRLCAILMCMDGIDSQIIALLAEDGRRSFADCGHVVGLSASAVKRRVDRLQEQGVIRGFTVVVDPTVTSAATEAFLEMRCRGRTRPIDIRGMLEHHPQVVAAYTVSGDADALVHLRTGGIAELEETIERIRAHQNTERTTSVIVLSRLIDRRGPATPILSGER